MRPAAQVVVGATSHASAKTAAITTTRPHGEDSGVLSLSRLMELSSIERGVTKVFLTTLSAGIHASQGQTAETNPKLTKGGRPAALRVPSGRSLVRQPKATTPRKDTRRARREEEGDPSRHRRPDRERALAPRRRHRNHR